MVMVLVFSQFLLDASSDNLPIQDSLDTTNILSVNDVVTKKCKMLWIDAGANLSRFSSEEKIRNIVKNVKDTGFNTIVLDVKPIVGCTIYPSKYTKKLEQWLDGRTRTLQNLPKDFDPLKSFEATCKRNNIQLLVSMNAFSEGHTCFHMGSGGLGKGPGYGMYDEQTVLYESWPVLSVYTKDNKKRLSGCMVQTIPNRYPKESMCNVYTALYKIPNILEDDLVASIDKNYKIVEVKMGGRPSSVPPGGSILLFRGSLAESMNRYLLPGNFAKMLAKPQYVSITEMPHQQYALMMNPVHHNVQKRALKFVKEIFSKYDVDGIIYDDRMRFAGMNADFSNYTKMKFEYYLGKKVDWDKDIYSYQYLPNLKRMRVPGKYWNEWRVWRAKVIQDWVQKVKNKVKEFGNGKYFGVYVGSWYGEYDKFGVNYASKENKLFQAKNENYAKTGFAEHLDFLIPGCYYGTISEDDARKKGISTGRSVEGACKLMHKIADNATWIYPGVMLSSYKNRPHSLAKAAKKALDTCHGIMVFDYSHNFSQFQHTLAPLLKSYEHESPHKIVSKQELYSVSDTLLEPVVKIDDKEIELAKGASGIGL